MLESVGDLLWYTVMIFFFIAYLIILFQILADLFRDHSISSWIKVVWIIFLVLLPYLTAFVYVLARGRGMVERSAAAQLQAQRAGEDYIRGVAGKASANEIADAHKLLEAGIIEQQEFDRLKEKALK